MSHHEWLTRQWHSMYMRGWDDSLSGNKNNPYQRRDFRRAWKHGYDDCMAGKPLPHFYQEWYERAGKRFFRARSRGDRMPKNNKVLTIIFEIGFAGTAAAYTRIQIEREILGGKSPFYHATQSSIRRVRRLCRKAIEAGLAAADEPFFYTDGGANWWVKFHEKLR